VQAQIRNERLGRKENWIGWQTHFDPWRFVPLMQGWINLCAGHDRKL